jgi:hypothetical protein
VHDRARPLAAFAQRRFEQRLMRQPSLPLLKAAQVALSSA